MRRFCIITASLIAISLPNVSKAAEATFNLFGHDVKIQSADFEEHLIVDGRDMLSDESITFNEFRIVSGIPVVIGTNNPGGNACETQRFVLSFPDGGKARLDGPTDNCAAVTVDLKQDSVRFESATTLTVPGHTWEWTKAVGLKLVGETQYQPKQGTGWATLRERTQSHPFDVASLEEISAQIKALAGREADDFLQTIAGTGSGGFDHDIYYGEACTQHSCGSAGAMIVADVPNQKVYIAWVKAGEKIKVAPVVKVWPASARQKLKEWAKDWD